MQTTKRKTAQVSQVNSDPYLTAAKVEEFKKELDRAIKVMRPRLSEEVAEHAKLGDFSENAAYQIAKGKLRGLNNRILVLQETLKNAILIEKCEPGSCVQIGSHVTISSNGQEKNYHILGAQETDPGSGRISHLSPLGAALIGHKEKDEVALEINGQINKFTIIKIW